MESVAVPSSGHQGAVPPRSRREPALPRRGRVEGRKEAGKKLCVPLGSPSPSFILSFFLCGTFRACKDGTRELPWEAGKCIPSAAGSGQGRGWPQGGARGHQETWPWGPIVFGATRHRGARASLALLGPVLVPALLLLRTPPGVIQQGNSPRRHHPAFCPGWAWAQKGVASQGSSLFLLSCRFLWFPSASSLDPGSDC